MAFPSTMWTLIDRARGGGDDAALRTFMQRYWPAVVAYCARRGMASVAEDLAQEVFLRLFTEGILERVDPAKGRFRSLLLAVARNVIGHHLRREHAEKRGGGQVRALDGVEVAAPEQDEEFDREWAMHLLRLALERLAGDHPNYHQALQLFVLEGKPYAEVAAALGKAEGDVKNYVFRGRAKLSQYLRDEVRDYCSSQEEFEEELRDLVHLFPKA